MVIPNAVDVEAAPPARGDGDPPRIVTVGRLAAPKDALTLVRALALLGPIRFSALLVGDGPDLGPPVVEAEVRSLDLEDRVELAGSRADVPALLAAADVFVLSSRSEGAPISILEAMAAGLPVVACDVGGVGELVADGETGLLVPSADPARLAEALRRLVADPGLRRRLGAVGGGRAPVSGSTSPRSAPRIWSSTRASWPAAASRPACRSADGGRRRARAAACRARRRPSP